MSTQYLEPETVSQLFAMLVDERQARRAETDALRDMIRYAELSHDA